MDPLERQLVLATLGFRCLDFDYVQPPLSEEQKPCGGLRLLVKDQEALPREAIVAYLDDFSGSVLGWEARAQMRFTSKRCGNTPFGRRKAGNPSPGTKIK